MNEWTNKVVPIATLAALLLVPGLAVGQARSPGPTVVSDPLVAPMGTAAGSWTEIGCPGQTIYTPAAGDLVVHYAYAGSIECGAAKYYTGLWITNGVIHSKGRDVGLAYDECDLQNETAAPSPIPFATWGGYSKTCFSAVLGPGGKDGTAAFASSVNAPTGWGDARWRYGFWAAGTREAGFHVAAHTNQNGWLHPRVAYSNDTNADVLIESTGTHRVILSNRNLTITNSQIQVGALRNGGGGGAFIGAGRNLDLSGAAGVVYYENANGLVGFTWLDRNGCLRLGRVQPNATLPWTDTYASVVVACLP